MKKIQLKAKARTQDERGTAVAKKLRREGLVPAVIYGHDFTPVLISVSEMEMGKALSGEAGRNVLIEMHVAQNGSSQDVSVMVKDLQKNPLTSRILHVDFLHIVLKEKIRTKVPVVLEGEPLGVKEDGGVMIHGLRDVEVECLPTDIPNQFTVNVRDLRIGNSVHLSSLGVPEGVMILSNLGDTLVSVAAPAKEEVVEAPIVPADQVPAVAQAAPLPAAEGLTPEGGGEKPAEKAKAEKPGKAEKEKK